MANASHSRFTDEIFCTSAPNTSSIEVKTTEKLVDEIFSSNSYEEFRDGLIAGEEFNSKELYENYPPRFKDKNKRFIVDLLNAKQTYSPTSNKSILITRWKPFVPLIESEQSTPTKVTFQADVFNYQPNKNHQTIEWHLNFANNDLFAFYGGSLLPQDELQVLECIELAAMREYLVQTNNTIGSQTIGSDVNEHHTVPTPILISNTERVINLDTTEIYGNAFAQADEDKIRKALTLIQPPQVVNLIAIEAPSYGQGRYTHEQIRYILMACFTGFKAAQILAKKTHAMNIQGDLNKADVDHLRTIIHTGWWGCGAYGNNRQMMLITQILAAHWAQIDEIYFHIQNDQHKDDIEKAQEIVKKLQEKKHVQEIIDEIAAMNFEWDISNNT